MYKLIYFLLVPLIFFSCNNNSHNFLRVNTDKDIYQIDETIIVYIENNSYSPAYFYHCNYNIGFHVEEKEDSVWNQKYLVGIICPAIYLSGIIELTPGEKDTLEYSLRSSGTYRIAVPYSLEQTEDELTELLYSNEFLVQ